MGSAWDAIEAGAQRLVRKAPSPLGRDQAVAAFLETIEGREAYARYIDEQVTARVAANPGASPAALVKIAKARDEVWARIEQAASAIVEKSDEPPSREQAIARFLETAEGRALYADYVAGRSRAVAPAPTSKLAKTAPALTSKQAEFLDEVRKAAAAAPAKRRPSSPLTDLDAVAKADADEAWLKVEAAARELVQKGAALDEEDAIDRIFEERPELARAYLEAYARQGAVTKVTS